MQRSTYQQIIDANARRGDHDRFGGDSLAQITKLREEAEAMDGRAPLYLQFVPIRLVSIIEVFPRDVIANLIDRNYDILVRYGNILQNIKIDFAFAAHVERRELLVGHFGAHNAKLSSINGIIPCMDTLFAGFAEKLKRIHPRWSDEKIDWPLSPIVTDYDAMIATLTRLFEIRHLLVHEHPSSAIFDPDELPAFLAAAHMFIAATDWCVFETLRDSVPESQLAMTMSAADDLQDQEKKLESALQDAAGLRNMDGNALHEVQAVWSSFADKNANLISSQVEGGTMYPMLWAYEKAALVRDRTRSC